MNAGIGIVYFVPVSPAALCPGPHDGSTGSRPSVPGMAGRQSAVGRL